MQAFSSWIEVGIERGYRWHSIEKEYDKAVYCHIVCLTYAECIMRSAGLDEA